MSKRQLIEAAAIVAVASVTSRILGFLREVTLAARFGATSATDAYLVASVIPVMLVTVVGNALAVTVIPVVSDHSRTQGREAALRLVNNLLNITLLASTVLVVAGEIFAAKLVSMVSPGFHGQVYTLTVQLTRIMLPALAFHIWSGLVTGTLQAFGHFTAPALVGIPFNVLIIGSILVLGPQFGIFGVALGTLIAIASQVAVQWPALRRQGYRYQFVLDLKDQSVRRVGRLVLPVVLGTSAGQLGLVVDRMLASGLPAGSISALNYAQKLNALPQNVFAAAISTVVYPRLSQAVADRDWSAYRRVLSTGLRAVTFLMCPMAVGLVVLREPIVRVLFERGVFDAQSTAATAYALRFFGLGLVFAAVGDLAAKAFYALQDTMTPLYVGLGAVAVNIVVNLLLIRPLAHGGLALGTSAASLCSVTVMLVLLQRKTSAVADGFLGRSLFSSAIGAIVMGAGVWLIHAATGPLFGPGFVAQALRLAITIVFGGVSYFLVCWATGSPDVRSVLGLVRIGWQRLVHAAVD